MTLQADQTGSGDIPVRSCFLGVESSLLGKRWEERLGAEGSGDERHALLLTQRLNLPEIIGRVLAGRGVSLEEAENFLNPTLRDFLPDPSRFQDMDKATAAVASALEAGQKVAVFGDYDVDGATSTALIVRYFRGLGRDLAVHIPDRIAEGYGPNLLAMESFRKQGCGLVLTVDCGTTAFEVLEETQNSGLSVVVLDHHEAEPKLPAVTALVNPNRQDEDRKYGNLAACGVVFLFLIGLNRELRNRGFFEQQGMKEPNLMALLDLVALGTVCDVVPLTGLNRAYVAQGLKLIARRSNAGIVALSDLSGLKERPDAGHLGFSLGPRVNAGGRVGEASLGARLLSNDNASEAEAMAQRLDKMNDARKELEDSVLLAALDQAEQQEHRGCVIVAGQGWHPGVIGIVASRLKERFNLPALVIAFDEHGVGKGSGRSVPGVDLGAAVIAARQQGLLEAGGGHVMAAGLTVLQPSFAGFTAFMQERLDKALIQASYVPTLGVDGALSPSGVSADLVDLLEACGPYGTGNAQPRFVLPSVRVVRPSVVGEKHVRCILTGQDGASIKAIAFRSLDTELGQKLLNTRSLPLHVAGKLKKDTWAGPDGVQLIVEDAAEAS
ncbi:single-stranded-DNA-specific exonuclease RecJ [Kiloniella sp. b19]|uniref:single-stranded-DNA-specific exonuclease RecJ n=1 Tax=Kiloniella sp. GXU_MW_B19 TaxID=3141326 RepID=UPI0031D6D286